jgi:hypothetical protein
MAFDDGIWNGTEKEWWRWHRWEKKAFSDQGWRELAE